MHEIDLNVKPSRLGICFFTFTLIGVFFILYNLPLSLLIKSLILLWLFLYSINTLRKMSTIKRIMLNANGWMLENAHETFPISILGDSTLTTWFCILCYTRPSTSKRNQYAFVIFKDAVSSEQYRRLLVALRNEKLHSIS